MKQKNLDIYGGAPIPWSRAVQQLEAESAKSYWLATVRPDGRPHVAGVGALCEPSTPQLRGIETFQGKIFHSSRWDHEYDLTGRSVAACSTDVLDKELLAKAVGKLLRHQARDDVGRAAGRKPDHHAHRPVRISLRPRWRDAG